MYVSHANRRRLSSLGLLIFATVFGSCIYHRPPKPTSNWTADEARLFTEFPLYWLEEDYRDMPLLAMRLTVDGDDVTRTSFHYGQYSFVPGSLSGGSWQPQLEIDIQPYCGYSPKEHLSYEQYFSVKPVAVHIRGVSGYLQRYSKSNASLFLWSGESTIHLYTWKSELDIEAAANELVRLAPDLLTSAERLPPPTRSPC